MPRILLADAIGRKPGSSEFRILLSSSAKYGLTTGNEKSDTIALTGLGTSIVRPLDSAERTRGIRQAAMEPELLQRLYKHYDNGKLPEGDFFRNVLERNFGVPRDRCDELIAMLIDNGLQAGFVRELQGTRYVLLSDDSAGSGSDIEPAGTTDILEDTEVRDAPLADAAKPAAVNAQRSTERFIFIAHGKNRKPLEQLEKVLKQFGIPYKIAVDEPQMARPISAKVAQVMHECHSAILIFTADEEYRTPEGEPVWRPNDNVTYELGAAAILYENRIVIFKEDGVQFPSDFRDIGYIAFEKDRLDAKGADLIKELIALGLVKVQAA
jgi:predicted nucleotide-binding protein